MKTTKFFSVLSLVLIFAGVNAANSNNVLTDNPKKMYTSAIRYEVNIHLPSLGVNICNTYLVQVTDGAGNLVAPAKKFVPGVSKYVFIGSVSVPGKMRVASLVLPSNTDPYVCPTNLMTTPDVIMGSFLPGRTYSFDLYPVIQTGSIRDF